MKTYLAIICAILALFLLAGCASTAASPANIDAAEISSVPPAEVKLDQLSAKTEALADAGLRESEVSDLRTEYEVDDGVPQYEVDFRSGDTEYSYTIHAETGAILEKDQDHEPVKQPQPTEAPKVTEPPATEAPKETQPAEEKISASKAKSIALTDAGLKESDVTGLRAEYDREDNEYDVDFRSGDYEYDYTIAAKSGKIRERDKEYDPVKKAEPKPEPTEPPATEAPRETQPAEEKISASKAKSIALNHAGVSSDDARGMECEYDADDGVKLYEVSFRSGKYEYDYEINALTGKIISWDKEIDD